MKTIQLSLANSAQHPAGYWGATFEPTTARFLVGAIDGAIQAYAQPSAGPPAAFGAGHLSYVHLLASLPGKKQVVSAGFDRRLRWWDATTGTLLRELTTAGRPLGLAVSPDETLLAIAADDRSVRLVASDKGEYVGDPFLGHPTHTPKQNPSVVYSVAFSPDGKLLASGDRVGTIVVREVTTGKTSRILEAPRFYSDFNKLPDGTARVGEYELGGARSLIFSPDGLTLFVGGMDQYDPNSAGIDGPMGLIGFDLASGQIKWEWNLGKRKGYLQALLFHPTGVLLAAGGGGAQGSGLGTICAFDLENPTSPVIQELEMTVRGIALASDGASLAAAGMLKTANQGQFDVWNLAIASG